MDSRLLMMLNKLFKIQIKNIFPFLRFKGIGRSIKAKSMQRRKWSFFTLLSPQKVAINTKFSSFNKA